MNPDEAKAIVDELMLAGAVTDTVGAQLRTLFDELSGWRDKAELARTANKEKQQRHRDREKASRLRNGDAALARAQQERLAERASALPSWGPIMARLMPKASARMAAIYQVSRMGTFADGVLEIIVPADAIPDHGFGANAVYFIKQLFPVVKEVAPGVDRARRSPSGVRSALGRPRAARRLVAAAAVRLESRCTAGAGGAHGCGIPRGAARPPGYRGRRQGDHDGDEDSGSAEGLPRRGRPRRAGLGAVPYLTQPILKKRRCHPGVTASRRLML
jgi:hypothetical protein